MKNLLENRLRDAEKLKVPEHVRQAVLGLFRITLQYACVSLAEWIAYTLNSEPEKLSNFTEIDLTQFYAPADGTLVNLLTQLLVASENLGWRSVGKIFWEQNRLSGELAVFVGAPKANIETILGAFVKARNDSVEGHGLAGDINEKNDVAVVSELIRCVANILPVSLRDGTTLVLPRLGDFPEVKMRTLRLVNGNPICYRKIKQSAAGRLLVDAQVQLTLLSREDIAFEVPDVFLELPRRVAFEYSIFDTPWEESWQPFIHIPSRLASQHEFTGRSNELGQLAAWADDADSRKCMIYGDGGVGKTTLVVEFLHRLLEGKLPAVWRPEIITFYTAKKTRWGLSGLEHISAQDIGVADVAIDIARMLTSQKLDKSWFGKQPNEVIQKLAGIQSELRINRDSHLIILDNTETMARSDADIHSLAMQINEISRRIGRVILTSRRREKIEALPIQTENWNEDEGAEFLSKRGATLKCKSISQAGVATLRRHSRLLVNKPIALEVFVQAASVPGTSLENAFSRVQRMQRQDLGNFLYEDAWKRMSPELRHVLLLMSRIGDTHDQHLMQLCCSRANVTILAASEAIEESKGIASISRFEGALQIVFNPEFFNYCAERTELIEGKELPLVADIEWVQRRYKEFIVSASAQVSDRNMKAYRVPSARAAWKFFMENKKDIALEYYEIAVLDDHENGWLFERYAYTLFLMKKYELAFEMASKALNLLPEDAAVYFTKGMIEGRLGRLENSLANLREAALRGKSSHSCELQMAYAYVCSVPIQLDKANNCIENALRLAPKDKFLSRFKTEVTRFKYRWLQER